MEADKGTVNSERSTGPSWLVTYVEGETVQKTGTKEGAMKEDKLAWFFLL